MSTIPLFPVRGTAAMAGALALLCGLTSTAFAQKTPYIDVPEGAYYEDAAAALRTAGALDANVNTLRPSDLATRAELVKLLVNLNSKTLLYSSSANFDDVSRLAWYFPYFEAAANVGWIHGDGNCYQASRPCTARPSDPVNRAEAAALIARAFSEERTGAAPIFADNPQSQWYYLSIQTAADHCVLQGDTETGRVRPAAYMNRAEMVVMFHRAYLNQRYGVDCGVRNVSITHITPLSPSRLRVTFSEDLNAARAEDAERYAVVRVSNGTSISVESATIIGNRTVELALGADLSANVAYTLTAHNLLSRTGMLFTSSERFNMTATTGHITGASALSSTRVRVTFDTDLDIARAQDEGRYTLTRTGASGTIGIRSATIVDARTVDLMLATMLQSGYSYRISVQSMLDRSGVIFSDNGNFDFAAVSHHITNALTLSSTRIRVNFDTDLDTAVAQDESLYALARVSDGGNVPVQRVILLNRHTVDVMLGNNLAAGVAYELSVENLRTSGGDRFSDSTRFTYPSVTGHILEVTTVSSTKLRLVFDIDLDTIRAEEESHYIVIEGGNTLEVRTANLLGDRRTVELTLASSLQTQAAYTVNVQDMLTVQGVLFSDSDTVVYDAGSVTLTTLLTGIQQVPPVSTTATGTGSFTLTANGLTYDITVRNLSSALTAAHFHLGGSGVNGSVLIPITFNGNRATGTWTDITNEQRNAILDRGVYVNVHTANYPDGEIRGQLITQ